MAQEAMVAAAEVRRNQGRVVLDQLPLVHRLPRHLDMHRKMMRTAHRRRRLRGTSR